MNGSPIKQPMRTEAIEACIAIMRCSAMRGSPDKWWATGFTGVDLARRTGLSVRRARRAKVYLKRLGADASQALLLSYESLESSTARSSEQ